MLSSPMGLFITWTIYGTFLPGDYRGWRHRNTGNQISQPLLEQWHRERLNYEVVALDVSMRRVVEAAVREICHIRSWGLRALSVRSNHVHAVVTAPDYKPTLVRDQLKAKATNELRKIFPVWKDRPVWAANGDIEFLDSEFEIERCGIYTCEAQDRKDRRDL